MSDEFSFFDVDDMDEFDAIPDDPFFMEDGTYHWKIIAATAKPTNAGDKTGFQVKVQCISGPYKGNTMMGPWSRIPLKSDADLTALLSGTDDEKDQAVVMIRKLQSRLKKDFTAFGFGADEIRKLNFKDTTPFIGREVMGKVVNKTLDDGSTEKRIVAFYKADEVSGDDGTGGFGQFSANEDVSFSSPANEEKPKPTARKGKPAAENDVPF